MDFPKDKLQKDAEYYLLTFSATIEGQIELCGQTMWVGFADEEQKIELRKFSLVKPDQIAEFWIEIGMPFCVVNDVDDFLKWYVSGGHALVRKDIATHFLPLSFEPFPCVQLGKRGFTGTGLLSETIFKKAPTPKKRMDVIKRDNFRCKVCGRKPDDYVDIELHVHHIRPFGNGGFTHEENLITLCDTCHKGLKPHYEWSLYDLLSNDLGSEVKSREQQKYLQGVKRYREVKSKNL